MAAVLLVGNAALAADDVAPALPSAGTDRWTLSGFGTLGAVWHEEDDTRFRRSIEQHRGGRGKKGMDPATLRMVMESGELPRTPAGESLTEVGRLIPKRLFNICVPDEKVEAVVKAIIEANSTGHPGDGKIFVMPVEESYVVRTGERADA